ncbi:MAG: class I SAM-dependent methyltransferase [Candidatus Promineifilaceae bacterium]|jgi:ubiquinone/menaquinone biosynthesis C-methylase UbiE
MSVLEYLWFQLVSIGFYLLYHQLAPTYDMVSWLVSFGKWREWQLAALPFIQGPDVLDLAHGPGHMLITLQRGGYQVTGIDLSPQMGRLAMQKIRADRGSISILQAPAQKLPIASASFDTVLATFPTEFIAEQATLAEIHRVLRPNGRLVIVPQANLTGDTIPVRLLETLYKITGQRNIPEVENELNSQNHLLQIMEKRFSEAGFEVRIERVAQPGSEVIVVVAYRKNG